MRVDNGMDISRDASAVIKALCMMTVLAFHLSGPYFDANLNEIVRICRLSAK